MWDLCRFLHLVHYAMDVLQNLDTGFAPVHLRHIVVKHDGVVVEERMTFYKVDSLLPVLRCVYHFKVLGKHPFDAVEDEGTIVCD